MEYPMNPQTSIKNNISGLQGNGFQNSAVYQPNMYQQNIGLSQQQIYPQQQIQSQIFKTQDSTQTLNSLQGLSTPKELSDTYLNQNGQYAGQKQQILNPNQGQFQQSNLMNQINLNQKTFSFSNQFNQQITPGNNNNIHNNPFQTNFTVNNTNQMFNSQQQQLINSQQIHQYQQNQNQNQVKQIHSPLQFQQQQLLQQQQQQQAYNQQQIQLYGKYGIQSNQGFSDQIQQSSYSLQLCQPQLQQSKLIENQQQEQEYQQQKQALVNSIKDQNQSQLVSVNLGLQTQNSNNQVGKINQKLYSAPLSLSLQHNHKQLQQNQNCSVNQQNLNIKLEQQEKNNTTGISIPQQLLEYQNMNNTYHTEIDLSKDKLLKKIKIQNNNKLSNGNGICQVKIESSLQQNGDQNSLGKLNNSSSIQENSSVSIQNKNNNHNNNTFNLNLENQCGKKRRRKQKNNCKEMIQISKDNFHLYDLDKRKDINIYRSDIMPNTSHQPTMFMNNLIPFLKTFYEIYYKCRHMRKGDEVSRFQKPNKKKLEKYLQKQHTSIEIIQQIFDFQCCCDICTEYKLIKKLKSNTKNSNLQEIVELWESDRIRAISEYYILYYAYHEVIKKKSYRSPLSKISYLLCLQNFHRGVQKPKQFYKLL